MVQVIQKIFFFCFLGHVYQHFVGSLKMKMEYTTVNLKSIFIFILLLFEIKER